MNNTESNGLRFPELLKGILIKRRNRFVAEVELPDKSVVLAHCPNSGSMLTCCEPGRPVFISDSHNPERKCKYTWELIEMPSGIVGVNTIVPNKLVKHAILSQQIPELSLYRECKSEIKWGDKSRMDLLLKGPDLPDCYIEVKNCTLMDNGVGFFPDAVTTRGLKHIHELENILQNGHRAILFILVQRSDVTQFKPADHIDPEYGKRLRYAVKMGVELLCYNVSFELPYINLNEKLVCML